ncbi:hypothetical protein C7408_10633 [Paraburkholderia caballeronis]|nr:hypothetical protein C7408_10633 [Paraburkholderia caballeronis]TDV17831.1 hypothetical protein C7406_10533 [Paraburkholderia caballeronis]TDV26555.1 hypothetical protein C7404_106258 [Paraburkholderia caballeronis]
MGFNGCELRAVPTVLRDFRQARIAPLRTRAADKPGKDPQPGLAVPVASTPAGKPHIVGAVRVAANGAQYWIDNQQTRAGHPGDTLVQQCHVAGHFTRLCARCPTCVPRTMTPRCPSENR